MKTSTMKKTLLCSAVALAMGAQSAGALAVEYGTNNNNFTMLSGSGGTIGGTNLVKVTWDGTLNTDVTTAVVNMTISSGVPFFGPNWFSHDIKVYGPGTYVFEACLQDGSKYGPLGDIPCDGIVSLPLTMTVGPGQVGAHMLFDWSGSVNIDVINVWDVDTTWAYGGAVGTNISHLTPTDTNCFYTKGKNNLIIEPSSPECDELLATQWKFTVTDPDGDGLPGTGMVDGPFVNANATFNIRQQAVFDDTLTTLENVSVTTVDVLANDVFPALIGSSPFPIVAFDATTVNGGTVTDNGSNTFTYMPAVNFSGADSFTYTVDDGQWWTNGSPEISRSATATVNITVDPDADGDGITDAADNCPVDANTSQLDTDGDAMGDACDTDDDNDTVLDISDNCPLDVNLDQADADSDGIGDVCDVPASSSGCSISSTNITPLNKTDWFVLFGLMLWLVSVSRKQSSEKSR